MPRTSPDDLATGDLAPIAIALEGFRQKSGSQTTFSLPGFDQAQLLLAGTAELQGIIAQTDRFRLAGEAAHAAAKLGPITAKSLRKTLSHARSVFLQQRPTTYVFCSWITVQIPAGFRLRRMGNWSIRLVDHLPRRLDRSFPGDALAERLAATVRAGPWILATGLARTSSEAIVSALEQIDLLRGVWNLAHRSAAWMIVGVGPPRSLNAIQLGPLHTLHRSDGVRVGYWWEPGFPPWGPLPFKLDNWKFAKRLEQSVRLRANRDSVGDFIRRSLVRYCRGLDPWDAELSFIQLWGLLELLTRPEGRRGHDETIHRAANFFTGAGEFERRIITALARERHRSIHAGVASAFRLQNVGMLHEFVAGMLQFLILKNEEFRTLDEFRSFLSLPQDLDVLKRGISLRRRAVRWRELVPTRRRRVPTS